MTAGHLSSHYPLGGDTSWRGAILAALVPEVDLTVGRVLVADRRRLLEPLPEDLPEDPPAPGAGE